MKRDFYHVEVTDTFGGEANYCWVRRYDIDVKEGTSPIREAKKVAGWTGLRCNVENYGDGYHVHPSGMCQVMFITGCDDPANLAIKYFGE